MGGRGAKSRGHGGSGITVKSSESLISLRNEGKRVEADQVLTVLRNVERDFGVTVGDARVEKLGRGDRSVLAYMYRGSGDLGFNRRFFDDANATKAYDACVKAGYHPSRGKKSSIEAIAAHELGHRMNYIAAESVGKDMDVVAKNIVTAAAQRLYGSRYKAGTSEARLQGRVSGYAKESAAECVSEAYADYYCNGAKARASSRAVVDELKAYLKQGPRKK